MADWRIGGLGGSRFASVLERARGVLGRLLIEDGSAAPLRRSLAETLPGSVNQHGCTAALRLRWARDFLSGKTLDPFRSGPGGRRFAEGITRSAHHATAEKRSRPSLDPLVFAPLA